MVFTSLQKKSFITFYRGLVYKPFNLSWRLQVFTLPSLVTGVESRDRFKCQGQLRPHTTINYVSEIR